MARRQAEGAFRRVRPEQVVQLLLGATAQHAQGLLLGVDTLGLTDHDIVAQAITLLAGLKS